jgi:hypothetical protein
MKCLIFFTKIILLIFISLNSYSQEEYYDSIYCERDIEACRRNVHTLKDWVEQDFLAGDKPRYVYDNYMLVLRNSEYSLKLLLEKPNTKTRFKNQ